MFFSCSADENIWILHKELQNINDFWRFVAVANLPVFEQFLTLPVSSKRLNVL